MRGLGTFMNWLAILTVTTAMLGAMASIAQAQDEPTTQPEETEADNHVEPMRGYSRQFMGRWGMGMGAPDITDEDWDAASNFMREHSPNRWQLFERLSDGSPRRGPVMRMILARYQNLQSLKEEDVTLYDLRLQQLTLEDSIWGIVREMRTQIAEDRRTVLQSQLREKVSFAVDVWMKERDRRLQRLEETLKAERERLAADQKRREEMIENRLQRELERTPDVMAFPRRPRGGQ